MPASRKPSPGKGGLKMTASELRALLEQPSQKRRRTSSERSTPSETPSQSHPPTSPGERRGNPAEPSAAQPRKAPPGEGHPPHRTHTERTQTERTQTERRQTERTHTERTQTERKRTERTQTERRQTERTHTERTQTERKRTEHTQTERHSEAPRHTRQAPYVPLTSPSSLQPPGGLFSALVPVVVSIYARCMEAWEPQDKLLAEALATQGLSRASRGVVVKTLQGMTRWHGRLLGGLGRLLEPDGMAEEPAERLSSLDLTLRARLVTAAWARCLEGKSGSEAAMLVGLQDPNFTRALERLPQVLQEADKVLQRALEGIIPLELARAAEGLSLPVWLTRLWAEQLGWPTTVKLGRALLEAPPLTLRVNPHRIHRAQALELLQHRHGLEATRTPFSPFGLILPARIPLDDLSLYRDGLVEVQDEGSQLAALATGAAPGLKVLDLCAGAGGKILLIGSLQRLNGTPGETFACDPHPGRLRELRRRLSRADLTHVQVRQSDALDPHALTDLRGRMDRVLVDAPCSGLGALRRNPEARWRLKLADLDRFSQLQEKLLEKAALLVKPGGRVLYVTCTLQRAENEAVVEKLVQRGILQPAPLCQALGRLSNALALDPEQSRLSLLPHQHGTDGFFVCLLERPR